MDRFQSSIIQLGKQPVLFWCLLFAVNALTLPYGGFQHDARLYAAQVMERIEPGSFSTDLYLHFGSQDRFTIWTPLTAPLVRLVGLPWAYLLMYYVCKGLFLAAALRLVQRVVTDERAVVLSMLFIAMYQLPFGGQRTFHLNESFLTPRILAIALVMFSLERMLARRPVSAILLQALALVVHPIMALGGLTVYFFWGALVLLPGWRFIVVLFPVSILAAVVLFQEWLAGNILGHMDKEWAAIVLSVCYFVQPGLWTVADWTRILLAFTFGVLGATWVVPNRSRFLWAVTLAGAAGVIGSTAGVELHYRLLIQTSPYRTLWIVQLFAFPLMFRTAVKLWDLNIPLAKCPSAALLLLVAPIDWDYHLGLSLAGILVCFFLLTACFVWFLPTLGNDFFHGSTSGSLAGHQWLWKSTALTFCLGFLYLCLENLGMIWVFITTPPDFETDMHPLKKLQVISVTLCKLPLLALVVLIIRWISTRLPSLVLGATLVLLGIVYHPLVGFGSNSEWYGDRYSTRYPHDQFVFDYIKHHSTPKPMVYWCIDIRKPWFEGNMLSYFNWVQLSGSGFDRGNAVEGKRRCLLVQPFEIATLLLNQQDDSDFVPLATYYGLAVPFGQKPLEYLKTIPPPSRSHLLRLCEEKCLDFVVLEYNVDNLWCASSGRYFIYDCGDLRRRFLRH
jgi:hypothetical protein